MNQFARILDALNRADVRYVIVGGFAALLHGNNRSTADLDLVIDLSPPESAKAIAALQSIGMRPRLPVDASLFADPVQREAWYREKNMLVFTMVDPANPAPVVDLFVREPIAFHSLLRDAVSVTLQGIQVPVCSIDHLIEMKIQSARPHDLLDIDNLRLLKSGMNAQIRPNQEKP